MTKLLYMRKKLLDLSEQHHISGPNIEQLIYDASPENVYDACNEYLTQGGNSEQMITDYVQVQDILSSVSASDKSSYKNAVDQYMNDIQSTVLLDKEQEMLLGRVIANGIEAKTGSSDIELINDMIYVGQLAEKAFTVANTRLVIDIAKRYDRQGVPLLDLIQEGNIGLMKAVKKFDYTKGYRFSTYAPFWIRQRIFRSLAKDGPGYCLPLKANEQIQKMYKLSDAYEADHSKAPTPEELAGLMGTSIKKVVFMLKISRKSIVSLDTPSDDGVATTAEYVEDTEGLSVQDETYSSCLIDELNSQLVTLDPREERVIRLVYGLYDGKEHSHEECAKMYGLTRERIRQIDHLALDRLRHPVRARALRDYLK